MRLNFRVKIADFTFFAMIARTQTLEGMTSLQKNGKHIVMWDIENCRLNQAEQILKKVQRKYNLSDIYICSDVGNSYRAWCFGEVSFLTLLRILADSLSILDYNFFYYTVKRRKATLRTSDKAGRPSQRVVTIIESYSIPFPTTGIEKVVYDTGIEKRGSSLLLGGD
jgi:hypothetical protein